MLEISHEYKGFIDYWQGNGKRWNYNAGCLTAFYGPDTTLRDCVDQWVDEFFHNGEFDDLPVEFSPDEVRAVILGALTGKGRSDYENGALVDGAEDCEPDSIESPVWVLFVEYEE